MKVKEVIEQLNKFYSPDDDILVEWWDAAWFSGMSDINPEMTFTSEQWEKAVAIAENDRGSSEFLSQAGYGALEDALIDVLFGKEKTEE